MKKNISVSLLKERVAEYLVLEKNPLENVTEWAYVMLEPDFLADYTVTMEFLKGVSLAEFDAVCMYFDDFVKKYKSEEAVTLIEELYHQFYGDNKETQVYQHHIDGLREVATRGK